MATIFLDLDGTLSNPKTGISRSFIHALTSLGHAAPDPDSLDWVIGPALIDSFARIGVQDPQAALKLYRQRYTDRGLFENRVYDGIPEALQTLKAHGHILHLATAKPHVYARRITAHFGLSAYLDHQFGPELDGTRNDKAELLAHALQVLGENAQNCVMVGDRHHDFDAAKANGMPSVAVTWGFGNAGERRRASVICERPEALAQAVGTASGA